MDGERVKDDIKTTFLIANSIHALVAGLFPLSLCGSIMLTEGFIPPVIITLGYGAPSSALAALGYYAAFIENKKMLHTYSAMMGLGSCLEVATVVASTVPSTVFGLDTSFILFFNVHIGITLAAVVLAVALAKRAHHMDSQSGPSKGTRGTCLWNCVGYASALLLIIICWSYHFYF